MKKDVLITLKSIYNDGNDNTETELITDGVFSPVKGGFRITYNETEVTGFAGEQTEITALGDDVVSIVRTGVSGTNLVIEKSRKHHCHYGTPYGDLMIGVYTKDIKNDLDSDGGNLYLRYTIDVNSSFVSDNEIYLNISADNGAAGEI